MIIDLIRLKNNIDKYALIDFTYSFSKEELGGSDLLALDNVKVKGEITKNSLGDLVLNVKVDGIMILPCSITLEPIEYPFSLEINDELEKLLEEIDKNFKKDENTLDILPIIWENILIEVPVKVTKENVDTSELKGSNWELVTGERKNTNPELEKLKDLL